MEDYFSIDTGLGEIEAQKLNNIDSDKGDFLKAEGSRMDLISIK